MGQTFEKSQRIITPQDFTQIRNMFIFRSKRAGITLFFLSTLDIVTHFFSSFRQFSFSFFLKCRELKNVRFESYDESTRRRDSKTSDCLEKNYHKIQSTQSWEVHHYQIVNGQNFNSSGTF